MTPKISRVSGDIEAKLGFMGDTLAQYDTLEDVAMFSTTILYSMIPTDKIALAVIEDDILKSVSTIGERVIMDLNLEWPSINARTIKSGQTQLVHDTRSDPDYFPGEGRDAVTMLSELCVPVIHDGNVLGTVNFESRQPGRYTEEDARVAEAFARKLAEALHRVRGDAPTEEVHERYSVRNRSTMDNYYEILRTVHDGEMVLNRIVHRVALPWKRGKEMVNNLVIKGYLTREKISAARYVYRITDEGVKAMNTYDGIIENLRT
jgi:putative methionine-R-sulfoxide reductase with GAF domain/predicted transcriptional regulator